MSTLKQKHEAFITKIKADGGKTLEFKAPCCGAEIEDRAAPKGETWDTLTTCPHCGELFIKVTTSIKIAGAIPAHA